MRDDPFGAVGGPKRDGFPAPVRQLDDAFHLRVELGLVVGVEAPEDLKRLIVDRRDCARRCLRRTSPGPNVSSGGGVTRRTRRNPTVSSRERGGLASKRLNTYSGSFQEPPST